MPKYKSIQILLNNKANNKYMNNYHKNKEPSFLVYDDANNLYGFAMCKKLLVGDFKWVDNLSIFTETS